MADFYNRVFKECEAYLGKDTKKFLNRQIEAHLFKSPRTIDYSDKMALAMWIRISSSLILGQSESTELGNKILALEPEK